MDDTFNPNKLVIVKKKVREGKFAYEAVPQGSLTNTPNNSTSISISKQPVIKLVSNTPFFKLTSSSLNSSIKATWADEVTKAKGKTEAQIQESKILAQQAKDAKEKLRFEEQIERIRQATLEIKAAIDNKTLEAEMGDHAEELESIPNTKNKLLVNFDDCDDADPTTHYSPSTDQPSGSSNKKRPKSSKRSAKRVKRRKDLNKEDESDGLSSTVGYKKKPLIITLYLQCPQRDCKRLFSAQNEDGSSQDVKGAIAQHLAEVHRISTPGQCLVCLERLPKDHLREHLSSAHEGVDLWSCRLCPDSAYLFDSYEKLSIHHSRKHRRGRFMCAKEGCKFLSEVRLNVYRHLAQAHQEQKCSVCNLTFQYRSELQRHEVQHSERQAFVCRYDGCIFSTASKGACLQHVRVRHLRLPLLKKEQLERRIKPEREALDFVWFLNEKGNLIPCRKMISRKGKSLGPSEDTPSTVQKKVLARKQMRETVARGAAASTPKDLNLDLSGGDGLKPSKTSTSAKENLTRLEGTVKT